MKINVTRWQPDTCKCVIEYEWDSDAAEATREHTVVNTTPCEFHAHHTKQKDCFDDVQEENSRKNKVLEDIGKEINWEFDEDRSLKVDLSAMSEAEKLETKAKLVKHGQKVKEWQRS